MRSTRVAEGIEKLYVSENTIQVAGKQDSSECAAIEVGERAVGEREEGHWFRIFTLLREGQTVEFLLLAGSQHSSA